MGQLMLAKIERTAPMRQPAHDRLVRPEHLLAVDAEVLPGLVRPLGDHQPPGDQRRHITRPAMLDRQPRQIDILALPNHFLAGRVGNLFRGHIDHLLEDRQLVPGVLQTLGRFRFLQVSEQLANLAQRLHRFLTHAQGNAFGRAEQVGQYRHVVVTGTGHRFFEQQRRPTGTQHAIADLGNFQMGVDIDRDTLEFAGLFQLRHEVAQVVVFHRSRKSRAMPAKMMLPTQLLCRKALKHDMRSRPRIQV